MISQIIGLWERVTGAKAAAEPRLEAGAVVLPLDYVVDERDRGGAPRRSLRAHLARRRARRRQRDEVALLSDAMRADVGLPIQRATWRDELRFIVTPERTGLL